jgi:hypothetical protein
MSHKTHHYNQFLIHLDQQQQKILQQEKKEDVKDDLGISLQEIENTYRFHYNKSIFSGYPEEKQIPTYNPDLFNENESGCHSKKKENVSNSLPPFNVKESLIHKNKMKNPNSSIEYDFKREKENEKGEKEKGENEKGENEKEVIITWSKEIETIDDLLEFIQTYPNEKNLKYNVNLQGLHSIREELELLNSISLILIYVSGMLNIFKSGFFVSMNMGHSEPLIRSNILM